MRALTLFTLLLGIGMTHRANAALTHYVAEVYFVIEPQVVRMYNGWGYAGDAAKKEIQGDLDYFIFEVNKIYESLSDYGLYLEIRSKGVEFSSDEVFSSEYVPSGYLNPDDALKLFKTYLKDNKSYKTHKYDIAIVLTGYNLADGGNDGVAGYATVQAACLKSAGVGVVEFGGTHSTVMTLAHELGHSLGSNHDGDGNNCLVSDGYVMAPVSNTNMKNRWGFSSCSESQIVSYINTLGKKSCLTETTAKASTFSLKEEKNRDVMNRDKVCIRSRNDKTAHFCNDELYYQGGLKGDELCKVLWCGLPSENGCITAMPSEGMYCDVGKRCNKGECVTAPVDFPTPSNLNPACLFSDTKTTHLYSNFDGTCADWVEQNGAGQCYQATFQHRCCKTCAEQKTGPSGCEYGDHSSFCTKYADRPRNICFGSQLDTCCKVCKGF